jgi:hypothetical protein
MIDSENLPFQLWSNEERAEYAKFDETLMRVEFVCSMAWHAPEAIGEARSQLHAAWDSIFPLAEVVCSRFHLSEVVATMPSLSTCPM